MGDYYITISLSPLVLAQMSLPLDLICFSSAQDWYLRSRTQKSYVDRAAEAPAIDYDGLNALNTPSGSLSVSQTDFKLFAH